MKKLLAILLLSVASLFPQNMSGTGTVNDPYLIYNANDLDSIRLFMETYATGRYIKISVQADLDFSGNTYLGGYTEWFPIEKQATDTLVIEGNGYRWMNARIEAKNATHSVTGETSEKARFFGNWHSVNGNTPVRDSVRNIYFYNNLTIHDSTVTSWTPSISDNNGMATFIGAANANSNADWMVMENLFFRKCTVWMNITSTAWIPQYVKAGIVIGGGNGGSVDGKNIGVDSCLVWLYYGRINTGCISGLFEGYCQGQLSTWDGIFVSNSSFYFEAAAAYVEFAGTVGSAIIFPQYNGTSMTLTNSYTYNNYFKPDGALGGTSDPNVTGALWGEINPVLDNCYVAGNTYTSFGISGEGNENSWVGGYANHTISGATSIVDTTGLYATTYNGLYGDQSTVHPGVGDSLILGNNTTMTTLSTYTGLGWNFSTVWAMSATINDGYPYLQWAYDYLVSDILTLNNPTGGETFEQDSVVLIHWTDGTSTATYAIGEYSLDGGSNWIRIDSVAIADTSMSWTVPQSVYTTTGQVRVYTDAASGRDSTTNFTILPHALIEFLYPVEKEAGTIWPGDTAHVEFRSIYVESFLFYWSPDSSDGSWRYIDSVVVDTANGFVWDSTTYVWTFPENIVGPDLYGRATGVAGSDTALYVFSEDVLTFDYGFPVGSYICQYDDGGTVLEHLFHYDPSCGWASPTQTYYTRLIPDDGIGPSWTYLSEAFTWPYTGADHPEPDLAYTISGADTLPVPWTSLYDQVEVTRPVYKQREYFFDPTDSTLRCNDQANNIDSIFVADIGAVWPSGIGAWSDPSAVRLTIYNVQRTKLIGQYFGASIDLETLNDASFAPKIILNVPSLPYRTRSVPLLGTPIDPLYPETDQLMYINVIAARTFFRGIHPKAEKR